MSRAIHRGATAGGLLGGIWGGWYWTGQGGPIEFGAIMIACATAGALMEWRWRPDAPSPPRPFLSRGPIRWSRVLLASVGLYALGLILFVGGGYRMGLPIPDWLYLFLYCTPLLLGLVVVWSLRLLPR